MLEYFVAVASREFEDQQIEIYHGRDLYKISSFVPDDSIYSREWVDYGTA